MLRRKRPRTSSHEISDIFDGLPDDIVVSILCKLISTARCPSDFISILLTCKRLNRLGLHPAVLSRAGSRTFAIRAKNWSEKSHRFLKQCVGAGNVEACYTLGMIRFYCLQNRVSGASLMAKAAIRSHAPALYSLAVIHFNGSGGSKGDKDLRAAVSLCARAAYLGHIDALRELGHCLQDGYGVPRNVAEGRRLLVQANARELASVVRAHAPSVRHLLMDNRGPGLGRCSLFSDFGCVVSEPHPVNRFLTAWFGATENVAGRQKRSMCSHAGCGRPETRPNEFRRCAACGIVNYCSRACQAQDWKMRHKVGCTSHLFERLIQEVGDGDDVEVDGDGFDRTAEIEGMEGAASA